MPHLCFYVTGHGFGHASRVQALLGALLIEERWTVEVRTPAPPELFDWLPGDRRLHHQVELEPGVVQLDALRHDLPATLRAWQDHLQQLPAWLEEEARQLRASRAELVISDASPAGCAAGARAGLPTWLLGNFTWDWILEAYLEEEPGFAPIIETVQRLLGGAQRYLRLPMSQASSLFAVDEPVPLLARLPRGDGAELRRCLGIDEAERLILLSFGGYGLAELPLQQLHRHPGVRCLWDRGPSRPPHLLSVEGRGLHYPDLIQAADLVLCKPGYGIFSEAIAAGTPIVYVPRQGFREAPLLEAYLRPRWPCLRVPAASLQDGSWLEPALDFLAARPVLRRLPCNGAERLRELIAAAFQEEGTG